VFAELKRAIILESVVHCVVCQLTSFHLEIEELASQSQMDLHFLHREGVGFDPQQFVPANELVDLDWYDGTQLVL